MKGWASYLAVGIIMYKLEKSSSAPAFYELKERIQNIDRIAHEYGLYGRLINYQDDLSPVGAGWYLVVSMYPIDDDVDAYRIYNRIKRDDNLFYPKEFAIPVNTDNYLVALESVMDYCRDAEFLLKIYAEFDTKIPECIRYSELSGLKNWSIGRFNENMPDKFRIDCARGLKTFFKNENSIMGKEKRRFFRSSKYDEKASKVQRKADFANRESPIVRLPVLLESTKEIGKKKIGSFEFVPFCNYIKDIFPDIMFAVSEKEVIDLGLIDLAKRQPDLPAFSEQKPVTNEQYRQTIRDRFAKEGFGCINNMQPAYWEYYNIYYKKADEPRIIQAYNDVFLRFADHDLLQDLMARGPVDVVTIPVDSFHYFVAYAKKAGLKFNIDHRGVISVPSFTDIHVIYNTFDRELMQEIIGKLIKSTAMNTHISTCEDLIGKETLENKIKNIRGTMPADTHRKNDNYEKDF